MLALGKGQLSAFFVFLWLMFSSIAANASHIFGIDFYYKHVTGNTYTIYLVVYGDCSGSAFSSLPTSTPEIDIYNGNTSVSSINLAIQAPADGIDVSPVCPAYVNSTTCTSGTLTGVKKFVYSGNYTVSGPSAAWRFIFEGNMGTGASAGRSNNITNIVIGAAGSIIQLTDTLNNTTYDNNSAIYTTIATPFYCINQPANFNPGAVDPDGDSLRYYLVPGIDASTGTSVSYISPYTATAPLATATGAFSFSNATGQLSFTPNAVQRALVVYNVEEYHNGVLRGTTQREMTVVVLNSCTSSPPTGSVTGATVGTVVSGTELNICGNAGSFSFHIDPTDGGDTITMTVSGLPSGASFNIVGNGTTAPVGTFSWNTTGVAPGTYTFFIYYQNNACPLSNTQTVAYTITIYPFPGQSVTMLSPATCITKATFHIAPSGSFSPYTINEIQGGSTIQTITGVTGMITDSAAAGTYIIRTTNPDGCFVDTTITITAPNPPTPSVTTTAPLCPGGATGTATITGLGGLLPYTYSIGGGTYSSSNIFTGLSTGSYTLFIKDANGCIKDTTINIPSAPSISTNVYIVRPLCNNFADGTVTLSAFNSTGPYTYALGSSAYSSDSVFSSLAQGTYVFHIQNANGCIVDTTINLTDSIVIGATFSIANVLCNGGTATVIVYGTGSTSSFYSYAYNTYPYSASDTFSLPAGTYEIHVMDAHSCIFDTALTITQPNPGIITPTIHDVSCYGGNTGSVIVNISGGTPSYIYNIAGGVFGLSSTFSSLAAGTYFLGVQDANGCYYYDTISITQPVPIILDSVTSHMPSCHGGANGSVHIYAAGGTPAYAYAVGSGSYGSSSVVTGLSAGANIVYVKDANGCIKDTTLNISQPTAIQPQAFIRSSVCNTLANGQISISASGGTPGYTYALGSGSYSSSGVFSPLAAGTYNVSVKDANGCIVDTTLYVADSLHISGTFTVTPALCHDGASGIIIVDGVGGTSPYTYALGTGIYNVSNIFSGLVSTTYNIHIKDNNGCVDDTSVYVGQPTSIVPHITITEPLCFGDNNGQVAVLASGGTPGYFYSLNDGVYSTTSVFTSLYAGIDTVWVKDNNGCIHDTIFTIAEPSAIGISGILLSDISCYGGSNGMVTIAATGATPPYFYEANGSIWQNSNVLTGLVAGVQLVEVKDSHGCTIDTSLTLTQPQQLIFSGLDSLNPTCQGYKDGSIVFFISGGTMPYFYSKDNMSFSSSDSISGLAEGQYTFYIKDSNGCSIDTTLTFTGYPHILVDDVTVTGVTCYGMSNGAILLYATGGVGSLYYQLNGNDIYNDTAVFNNLSSGTYNVVVTDSKNCLKDTSIFVPQPAALNILLDITPNNCHGEANKGMIVANVSGGTVPYNYLWISDSLNAVDTSVHYNQISNLINATYYVVVTDSNDCVGTDTGMVNFNNCCTPLIPNAFTPNGDGKNDVFRILYHGEMQLLEFSIYNRFGQRVFYTQNPTDGWDGNFNGVAADLGVYYYFVEVICGSSANGSTILKGDVTLIR